MKTVLVSLPFHFAVRNVLYTPLVHAMASRQDVRWVLVTPRAGDGEAVAKLGYSNVIHDFQADAPESASRPSYRPGEIAGSPRRQRWRTKFHNWDKEYLFDSLCYRFHHLNDLAVLRIRERMSPAQQELERVYSNFVRPALGRPLANSRAMYRMLFRLRHAGWMPSEITWTEHLFRRYEPDLLVHTRAQWRTGLPFTTAARRRGIPIVSVIQSWDQPTTKGFIPPGANVYVVGSRQMAEELPRYHAVDPRRVENCGHTYADNYKAPGYIEERGEFMWRMGLNPAARMIVLCTNLATMKAHEIDIARRMAKLVVDGAYGLDALLYIRAHPQDTKWKEDFGSFAAEGRVVVRSASGFGYVRKDAGDEVEGEQDMRDLANLLAHASVVVNTRSSITLDAVAVDTPVICLAFDGDRTCPATDSVRVRYDFEFFRPLVDCGATWLVESYEALDAAIKGYMADRSLHAAGRAKARQDHFEPFDGRASERLVGLVGSFLEGKVSGVRTKGDWSRSGIT